MSSTAEKKRRRPRGELTREQVLSAALELADVEGLDGLTMRRLAEELGCGTMTLYTHVASRDDLLNGVVGLVIERLDLEHVPAETWQECARRTVSSYRALAYEHPGAFELLAFADNDVDPVATYFERLLWLFQQAGLSETAARTFLSVADGFVLRLSALRVPFSHPATAGRRGNEASATRHPISTTSTRARPSTRASTWSSEASRLRSPRP